MAASYPGRLTRAHLSAPSWGESTASTPRGQPPPRGSNAATGAMTAYDRAYKFNIPSPSTVNFDNHAYLAGNWGVSTGPCVAITITGLHGSAFSGTRYTLQNALGTSWTDTYPTGYGVADTTTCINHNGGPTLTSIHTGQGHASNPGAFSESHGIRFGPMRRYNKTTVDAYVPALPRVEP